jgi:hypothetical protein
MDFWRGFVYSVKKGKYKVDEQYAFIKSRPLLEQEIRKLSRYIVVYKAIAAMSCVIALGAAIFCKDILFNTLGAACLIVGFTPTTIKSLRNLIAIYQDIHKKLGEDEPPQNEQAPTADQPSA